MDIKLINSFLQAVETVLSQFGIKDIKKGDIVSKENMTVESDVTAFIGLVGEVRGNISYSFNSQTAMNLASAMMMGMPVSSLDEMARSAVAELANMFTGNAIMELNTDRIAVDITPPSLVMGEDMFFIIGSVTTISVIMETGGGEIEVNFGLE